LPLTDLASGRVHLGTANGGEAPEEHVELVGGHVPREVTTKYLRDHAEEHHISGTETKSGKGKYTNTNYLYSFPQIIEV